MVLSFCRHALAVDQDGLVYVLVSSRKWRILYFSLHKPCGKKIEWRRKWPNKKEMNVSMEKKACKAKKEKRKKETQQRKKTLAAPTSAHHNLSTCREK
jgi:hypothetical protein